MRVFALLYFAASTAAAFSGPIAPHRAPSPQAGAASRPTLANRRLDAPAPATPALSHLAVPPRMMGVASAARPLAKLWPDTLIKLWGLHALGWGLAFVPAALGGVWLGAPIAAANLCLALFLYRSREDLGKTLALAAAGYFSGAALTLRELPSGSGYNAALAAGYLAFSLKAYLKDRLFEESGALRRGTVAAAPALPLLAFINQKAGAKVGDQVSKALREAAEEAARVGETLRVVDLNREAPLEALRAFAAERGPVFQVLVCGGDGTASWVLSAIEEAALKGPDGAPYRPAVALLPLGTGNDLARVLGWGKSVRLDAVRAHLRSLRGARPVLLDRWQVRGSMPDGKASLPMSNYMSIGVDAQAALRWARLSKTRPELFRLRLLNKLWLANPNPEPSPEPNPEPMPAGARFAQVHHLRHS